jgi:hypothetical protein
VTATPAIPAIPANLRASWDQAEARVYQVVLTRPDLYQRAVVLVGQVSAALVTQCRDPAGLVARAGQEQAAGWPQVHQVAEEAAVPMAGLDPDQVGRAACAMAARELVATATRLDRRDRLIAARRNGSEPAAWVLLEESGDPAGVAWAPYRRLQVQAGSGRGVLVSTEPDDDLVGVLHRVLPVRVDPSSGELLVLVGDGELPPAHPDAPSREAAVARLKARLDADPAS